MLVARGEFQLRSHKQARIGVKYVDSRWLFFVNFLCQGQTRAGFGRCPARFDLGRNVSNRKDCCRGGLVVVGRTTGTGMRGG